MRAPPCGPHHTCLAMRGHALSVNKVPLPLLGMLRTRGRSEPVPVPRRVQGQHHRGGRLAGGEAGLGEQAHPGELLHVRFLVVPKGSTVPPHLPPRAATATPPTRLPPFALLHMCQKDGDPDPRNSSNASHPWPIRGGGGVIEWVPEPNVFQDGLTDWLQKPTFLHNRAFSTENRSVNRPMMR